MDYRKPNPGDDLNIPAGVWSELLGLLAESRGGGGTNSRPTRSFRPARQLNACVIPVYNQTGATIERYRAVAIDAPVVLPADNAAEFQRRVVMKVITPTADHEGRWAIVQDSIPVGQWGQAVVSGISIARLNVVSANDEFAEISAGSTLLDTSVAGSARILWKESGTGEKWGVILLNGTRGFWAELTEEHGSNFGTYKWKRRRINSAGTAFEDVYPAVTSGANYSAVASNRARGMIGLTVWLEPNNGYFGFEMPSTGRFKVKMDGGSGGSDGVFASWKYSIYPFATATADIEAETATPIATLVEVESRLIPVQYDHAEDGTICIAAWNAPNWFIISGCIAEKVHSVSPCEEGS